MYSSAFNRHLRSVYYVFNHTFVLFADTYVLTFFNFNDFAFTCQSLIFRYFSLFLSFIVAPFCLLHICGKFVVKLHDITFFLTLQNCVKLLLFSVLIRFHFAVSYLKFATVISHYLQIYSDFAFHFLFCL